MLIGGIFSFKMRDLLKSIQIILKGYGVMAVNKRYLAHTQNAWVDSVYWFFEVYLNPSARFSLLLTRGMSNDSGTRCKLHSLVIVEHICVQSILYLWIWKNVIGRTVLPSNRRSCSFLLSSYLLTNMFSLFRLRVSIGLSRCRAQRVFRRFTLHYRYSQD
jgi:hypothetical protein